MGIINVFGYIFMPVRDDISQMLRYSSSMNFELIILKKLSKTCANFGLVKLL